MNDKTDLVLAIAAATAVMAILSGYVIHFVIVYRKKQRAFEHERESFKQALLRTEIEIKEQTLGDISRELHDNLGQIASLIKINLNLVLPNLSSEDEKKVSESLDLLKQLIKDIRSLSVSLKGENLERFGLIGMIAKDVERYEKTIGLKIHFSAPAELPQIDQAIQVFLYRMSQEIFNNIIKHAEASAAEVLISVKNNSFMLSITDNGKGFDPLAVNSGSGLLNLNERCRIIGAELEIKSRPEQGTTIIVELKV